MALIQETDYGTPKRISETRSRWRSTASRSPCRPARRSCAPQPKRACRYPSFAPATISSLSVRAACAWSKSKAAAARPLPAPLLSKPGMKVRTQSPKLAKLRRGVMELYVSDFPPMRSTAPPTVNCEFQEMAVAVGLREVRYGLSRPQPSEVREGRIESVFHVRSGEVHRLLALRARLRRSAGHASRSHRRARLRFRGFRRRQAFHRIGMRFLRRVRAGLPHRQLAREIGDRKRARRITAWSPPAPTAAWAARSRRRCRAMKSSA